MERNIELQLWEYIDGACTDAERQRMALLIQNNTLWADTYKELQAFQLEMVAGAELQEPHMRFTQNIMDAIAGTQPIPAMRRYINRTLMRGLAAFFIISIGISLLVALFSANWQAPARVMTQVPSIDMSGIFSPQAIFAAMGVVVILGLVFVEQVLRMKRVRHQ